MMLYLLYRITTFLKVATKNLVLYYVRTSNNNRKLHMHIQNQMKTFVASTFLYNSMCRDMNLAKRWYRDVSDTKYCACTSEILFNFFN